MDEEYLKHDPLIAFGILADVQYADVDDCLVYGRMRYYRSSLDLFKNAIDDLKRNPNVKFILQLGDLVDGVRGAENKPDDQVKCLDVALGVLDESTLPTLHLWGNHEVYAFGRDFLAKSALNTCRRLKQKNAAAATATANDSDLLNYYFYDVTDNLRIVCLDVYEISPYGYDGSDKTNENKVKAIKIIEDAELKLQDETLDAKSREYLVRFSGYNGAVGEQQLKWLDDQLRVCRKLKKRVVLCTHTPLLLEASNSSGVVWNANELLKLVWSYDNLVIAVLAGHYHTGGYFVDEKQIHHVTLKAILETPPGNNSHATAYVYENKFVFKNESNFGSFSVDL
jgi:manganese-dependent ADP-ribose/CDP-alcohol diphosphatase